MHIRLDVAAQLYTSCWAMNQLRLIVIDHDELLKQTPFYWRLSGYWDLYINDGVKTVAKHGIGQ